MIRSKYLINFKFNDFKGTYKKKILFYNINTKKYRVETCMKTSYFPFWYQNYDLRYGHIIIPYMSFK